MKTNLYIFLFLISIFGFSQNSVRNYILGDYNSGSFISKTRGEVKYEIYLPINWKIDSSEKYPVVIGLHGQGANELSFVKAISSHRLNRWIEEEHLSEFVFIAIRGGKNVKTMQWTSVENVEMLTNKEEGELQYFLKHVFNIDVNHLAIIGHSRGASGALNLAFKYPENFKRIVSSAYVSDYNLSNLKTSLNKNVSRLKHSSLKLKLIIGTEDQYVLKYNRKGTYKIHEYLNKKNISHEFEVLNNKNHYLKDIFKDDTALSILNFCLNIEE